MIQSGFLSTTKLDCNIVIAYEEFNVENKEGFIFFNSCTRILNSKLVKNIRYIFDENWIPLSLCSWNDDPNEAVTVHFNEKEIVIKEKKIENIYSFDKSNQIFLISGNLSFPLTILQRIIIENEKKKTYNLFPGGICIVERLEDFYEDDEKLLQFSIIFQSSVEKEHFNVLIDEGMNNCRYTAREANVTTRLR